MGAWFAYFSNPQTSLEQAQFFTRFSVSRVTNFVTMVLYQYAKEWYARRCYSGQANLWLLPLEEFWSYFFFIQKAFTDITYASVHTLQLEITTSIHDILYTSSNPFTTIYHYLIFMPLFICRTLKLGTSCFVVLGINYVSVNFYTYLIIIIISMLEWELTNPSRKALPYVTVIKGRHVLLYFTGIQFAVMLEPCWYSLQLC